MSVVSKLPVTVDDHHYWNTHGKIIRFASAQCCRVGFLARFELIEGQRRPPSSVAWDIVRESMQDAFDRLDSWTQMRLGRPTNRWRLVFFGRDAEGVGFRCFGKFFLPNTLREKDAIAWMNEGATIGGLKMSMVASPAIERSLGSSAIGMARHKKLLDCFDCSLSVFPSDDVL
ncbi:hypothetical protein [Terricaulis sp.]|uniref:hypothetical protein n=1 Tax=Terricaulis sp. TaxID=2768686 RepID=UPI002AC48B07|nr:hypothetical protein [Terricaulis sp.]MDZ4689707.1 hypothetical protein [Terricaulis sp.]